MPKTSALDLASGVGGMLNKQQVKSAVEQYEKYHDIHGGDEESRKSNYADLVNKYYDLVTSLYEYGWGDSFHFASRWHGETLRESIKRHEHFIALQLGLKKGMKVLDVGCGIGGPLIEIARFSSTLVTGLNNNDYQISRGQELIYSAGLNEQCNFVKGDFMNMPIPDDTFDAAYALEATCHAPDALGVYREIYRVLKPGQYFALDEWCMTDRFDPNNAKHRTIKAEIELGDGLPDIRSTRQCIQAMKDAGFEVKYSYHQSMIFLQKVPCASTPKVPERFCCSFLLKVMLVRDLAEDSPLPWYQPMDPSLFSLSCFQCTRVGRFITRSIVNTLEFLRIAPQGSVRAFNLLVTANDSLLKGGQERIFTPIFFVLGRKPLQESEIVKGDL